MYFCSFPDVVSDKMVFQLGLPTYDATGIMFESQPQREYAQGSESDWLHMQVGNSFNRAT